MASRFSKIVDAIMAAPELDGVAVGKGRLALKENSDAPRLVWVPVSASHEDGHNVGGRLQSAATERSRGIRTRMLSIEVHCWGYDASDEATEDAHIEATENLIHGLLAATWRCFRGMVDYGGETWFTQTPAADHLMRGEKAVVTLGFQIPVLEEEKALTTITSQSHTTTFVSDLDSAKTEVVC